MFARTKRFANFADKQRSMDVKNLSIEKVTHQHLDELETISRRTFHEAFADKNSEENMRRYMDNSFSGEKLSREIVNPGSEFYFAVLNDEIIGYLKVNWGAAQTELQNDRSLEIERIYVLKEFHGTKVGQLLYEKAIEIASRKDMEYVWLGVWEENSRAIRFYAKNGFAAFDKHIFKLGNDEQTDIMMKLQLNIGSSQ